MIIDNYSNGGHRCTIFYICGIKIDLMRTVIQKIIKIIT